MKHGQFTSELGEDLERRLSQMSNDNVRLFYDHGRRRMPKVVPYFGRYSSASTLSNVDCAMVHGKQVLVLCEIEEETATPKKIIGDICNLLLAKRVRIAGEDFSLDDSHLFLGVRIRRGGKGAEKAKSLRKLILNSIEKKAIRNMRIHVLCHDRPDVLIRLVSDAMMKAISNRLRNMSRSRQPSSV